MFIRLSALLGLFFLLSTAFYSFSETSDQIPSVAAQEITESSAAILRDLLKGLEREPVLIKPDGHLDFSKLRAELSKPQMGSVVQGRVFGSRELKPGQELKRLKDFQDSWAIPLLEVVLISTKNQKTFGPWLTDMSGRFGTARLPKGAYRLCVKGEGWQSSCRSVKVTEQRANLRPIAIRPLDNNDRGSAYGQVSLADGAFPLAFRPHAALVKAAKVTAFLSNGSIVREAYVNDLGFYVLPALPEGQRIRLIATYESVSQALQLDQHSISANGFLRKDLVLPNRRPSITTPIAHVGGNKVFSAQPGETVEVSVDVVDPDGDPVKVFWTLTNPDGSVSSKTGTPVKWTLPKGERLNSLRVLASDSKGGFAADVIHLSTSERGLRFSGSVSATDASAVPNAEVEVNGIKTLTNENGWFSVYVKNANRYVLNIRSRGYALLSQIYNRPVRGGQYVLRGTTRMIVDPKKPIVVVDEKNKRHCRGAPSANLNWKVDKRRIIPIRLGKGQNKKRSDQGPIIRRKRDCGPGVAVHIPANALVDPDGNAPGGMVEVSVATYDIEAEMEMPGDYTVAKIGEVQARSSMESYGAAFVEVRQGNTEFNLKEEMSAQLNIPVAPAQLAAGGALPATIPILHYDEQRGVWNRTGEAHLQGGAYRTKVGHFSAINADVEKVEPACIHVRTNGSDGVMPALFNLEVTIPAEPGSGGAANVRTGEIDSAATDDHVIYNVPENREDIALVPYDPATKIPYGTFLVDSGGPHGSPINPPDHNLCDTTVELFIPDQPRPVPPSDKYLQGFYNFFAANLDPVGPSGPDNPTFGDDLSQAALDYYAQVDPLPRRRDTFQKFKDLWGFDGTEDNARYANSADLGFGRDMHCVQKDLDNDGENEVACYVSNYGKRTDPDQDNANQAASQNSSDYVATVAMEHAPVENEGSDFNNPTFNSAVGKVVKFFVYAQDPDDPANETLQVAADLDLLGPRPIPQLCMVCHGGVLPNTQVQDSNGNVVPVLPIFDSPEDIDLQARFLPFDLDSYTFPDAGPVTGEQQSAFKSLNLTHVASGNPGPAIEELLGEYYAPGGTAATQNTKFVVPGWSGTAAQQNMYKYVVGTSCRICHAAHTNDQHNISFSTAAELSPSFAVYMACSERSMPHSFRTYERFWTSLNPHWPGQLINYASEAGVSAGDCTFPPNNGQPAELPE